MKNYLMKRPLTPSNEVMRGTTVVDGHGIMKVERVGDSTEIGKVARQATEQSEEETPLNIQLTKLAWFHRKNWFYYRHAHLYCFYSKRSLLLPQRK